MKKIALLLMIITITSKILGFFRDLTLSYFYGASFISDAYLISLTIPSVIFGFIAAGITSGYIPMFSKIKQELGESVAYTFTNNLINVLLVICTGVIILGYIFAEKLVKIFASGFEGETLLLAIQFTKITLFGVYFTSIIAVFSGFLNLKGNFIIPAMIGLPLNFITILSIYLSTTTSLFTLAIGSVIAIISQLLLVIPFLYKENYRYKLIINFKDEHIRRMGIIALPIIVGVSVDQINVLVDRTIASQIIEGGISALNYANRLNLFVHGIFVMSIITVLFPNISKMVAAGNVEVFKKSLAEAISGINLLVIPATIGAMIFAEPIVKFLFGRGAFDEQAVYLTANAFFYYSIGMLGYGLREVLSRAFYAMQDTKTPMINASIAVVLNIILNIILSRYLGIGGLALATSISAIIAVILLGMSLRKKIGSFGIKNILISSIKILCASVIMGIIANLAYIVYLNKFGDNLSLILAIGTGVLSYFILIYFMKLEEVEHIAKVIKRKLIEVWEK